MRSEEPRSTVSGDSATNGQCALCQQGLQVSWHSAANVPRRDLTPWVGYTKRIMNLRSRYVEYLILPNALDAHRAIIPAVSVVLTPRTIFHGRRSAPLR
jgi:hypothetical protein